MKSSLTLCALLALAAVGCTDDENVTPVADSAVPVQTDGGSVPTTTTPGDDAGVVAAPIPLILWVDDLVDHHTTDDSAPDTVDDKNISDDENPNQFDTRF